MSSPRSSPRFQESGTHSPLTSSDRPGPALLQHPAGPFPLPPLAAPAHPPGRPDPESSPPTPPAAAGRAEPPPPSPCPESRGSSAPCAQAGPPGMASSAGLPSEDRAPICPLLMSPAPWLGSQLSLSLLSSLRRRLYCFPKSPSRSGAPVCQRCSERHTPAPRPHSSRQGESRPAGRPCLSCNVSCTRTQTMIPLSLIESVRPRHPRGSSRRDPIVAQASGRPGADPADSAGSAHTFLS